MNLKHSWTTQPDANESKHEVWPTVQDLRSLNNSWKIRDGPNLQWPMRFFETVSKHFLNENLEIQNHSFEAPATRAHLTSEHSNRFWAIIQPAKESVLLPSLENGMTPGWPGMSGAWARMFGISDWNDFERLRFVASCPCQLSLHPITIPLLQAHQRPGQAEFTWTLGLV